VEGQRFDTFAKALGQSDSRRSFVKIVFAGLLGLTAGTAATAQPSEAQSGDCFPSGPCSFNPQATELCLSWCQQNFPGQDSGGGMTSGCCQTLAACSQGTCFQCGPGAPAGHPQVCTTPAGTVCCTTQSPCCTSGACAALGTNTNCTACGAACATGTTCCGVAAGCKNLQTDVQNCSTCGNTCTGTTPACCGGACKDLSNDNNNCSTCGNVCATGASCIAGACVCPAGQVICTGSCVNTQSNVNNCGACGTVCAAVANGSAGCVAGVCVVASCNAGFGNCDNLSSTGCETNLNTTNSNCGACGTVCPAGATCTNGACVCPAGTVSCNGTCLNTQSDINNCGFCGNVCGPDQFCANGTCLCATGLVICNGTCVNTQSDNNHCGTCGNVCAFPDVVCISGNCIRIVVGP
jgi:hypothetical protein